MTVLSVVQKALTVTATISFLVVGSVAAQVVDDPNPQRFAAELAAFAQWDTKNATPRNPVVFVGSSSIRFWNTGERFPTRAVVNRGFGGAHISDVNHFVDETVLRYEPALVVFYAGDNDIGAGKSNDQVFEDYMEFVGAVHASDAAIDIVFIPIKPSIARWSLWPQMREMNERVRLHAVEHDRLHYVDLASPILGPDGQPRAEFFVADGLHMTPAGYDAWTEVLRAYLDRVW